MVAILCKGLWALCSSEPSPFQCPSIVCRTSGTSSSPSPLWTSSLESPWDRSHPRPSQPAPLSWPPGWWLVFGLAVLSEDPPGLSEEKNRSWIELLLKKRSDTRSSPVCFSWWCSVHHHRRVGSKLRIPVNNVKSESFSFLLLECVEVDEGVANSVGED